MGHFMFSTMLDLMPPPSTRSSTMIRRRVPAYIVPNIANRIHDFIAPPREMLHFTIDTTIHRPLLVVAHQMVGSRGGARPYSYYFYGYIGNLLYCLEFVPECTRDNMIRANLVRGRPLARIEAILPGQEFPPDGVNDWALLQREDALSGQEGGGG
jgi:hypothetical protein